MPPAPVGGAGGGGEHEGRDQRVAQRGSRGNRGAGTDQPSAHSPNLFIVDVFALYVHRESCAATNPCIL